MHSDSYIHVNFPGFNKTMTLSNFHKYENYVSILAFNALQRLWNRSGETRKVFCCCLRQNKKNLMNLNFLLLSYHWIKRVILKTQQITAHINHPGTCESFRGTIPIASWFFSASAPQPYISVKFVPPKSKFSWIVRAIFAFHWNKRV